uniref:DhaK domain-containing protein n=1 Tax=Angiostrongylus cantonensis TaxID=6313 RepID=A0A0K0CYX9_ANGCA
MVRKFVRLRFIGLRETSHVISTTKHKNCRRVTLRSDYVDYCAKDVSPIAGGGSGHKPYSAGYIGSGMFTAAISGNAFASPPSRHVSILLGGSILFVINYTGDRLNFGLAAERYAAAGHHVRVHLSIADDVAVEASNSTVGRRGSTAAVLVIKIAGAMAESGRYTADEIEPKTNRLEENARTMGVSLHPCSLPGFGQTFETQNDIEPVLKARYAFNHMQTMLSRVECMAYPSWIDQRQELYPFIFIDFVVIVICGSLPTLNYSIGSHGITIARTLCGLYMTSLNIHGFSTSVLRIFDSKIIDYIDAPTLAPGWIAAKKIGEVKVAPSVLINSTSTESPLINGDTAYCRNLRDDCRENISSLRRKLASSYNY